MKLTQKLPLFLSVFISTLTSFGVLSAPALQAASANTQGPAFKPEERPLRVVTTTPDLASIVEEIGKGCVQVQALTDPAQDPRYADNHPAAALLLMEADLLIVTGKALEDGWLPVLVEASANRRIRPDGSGYIDASASMEALEASDSFLQPISSPYYLLDPENARKAAEAIKNKLVIMAPAHAKRLEQNYCKFDIRLQQKIEQWKVALEPYRGTEYVSGNTAYCYFAQRFGFVNAGTIEPTPGRAPTAQYLQSLAGRMQSKNVPMIWTQSWETSRQPQALSKKTDADVLNFQVYPDEASQHSYIQTIDTMVQQISQTMEKRPAPTRLGSL